jgi:hypothetical protein
VKLMLKFVIPLIVVLGIGGALLVPAVDLITRRWFVSDLERRSQLVLGTLQESLRPLLLLKGRERKTIIQALLDKVAQDERILAMGYCNANQVLEFKTVLFPADLSCQSLPTPDPSVKVADQATDDETLNLIVKTIKGQTYHFTTDTMWVAPMAAEETAGTDAAAPAAILGQLIMVHDLSVAARRSADTRNYLIALILIIGVVTSLVALIMVRWSRREWMNSMRTLLNEARKPSAANDPVAPQHREFQPILRDIKT